MKHPLLSTLNSYSKLAAAGNTNVIPAIGRIIEKIESDTGKKVVATKKRYVLK